MRMCPCTDLILHSHADIKPSIGFDKIVRGYCDPVRLWDSNKVNIAVRCSKWSHVSRSNLCFKM